MILSFTTAQPIESASPGSLTDFPMSCLLRKRNIQPLLTVKSVSLILNFSRRALVLFVITSPVTGNQLARSTLIKVISSCSRVGNFASLKRARLSVTVVWYSPRGRQIDFVVGSVTEKCERQSFKDTLLFSSFCSTE